MEAIKNILFRKLISHILFWSVSIVLFTVLIFYNRGFSIFELNLTLATSILSTMVLLAVSVYINVLWLIPVFFNKRKFVLFALLQILNIFLFILLNFLLTGFLEGKHPNYLSEAVAEFILALIFLVVTTLITFTRDSMALQGAQLRIKEVEREKIESELRALKAQVNPHFFFNTLNSMYALSLDKSDKTPELILRLSELMRYILYESADDIVTMERQLDFIRNYIYLERMRTDENLEVILKIDGEDTSLNIAPLLLIPFVENAFKHVAKENHFPAFIHIYIDLTKPEELTFRVENNKDPELSSGMKKMDGIGLANVKKRLDLLYPAKHQLTIEDSATLFKVELKIDTR